MDKQVYLKSETLSIMVGSTPNRKELEFLRAAYAPTTFHQLVVLSSRNLVQLCNFIRRCREERGAHKYLVFLQFQPHRDTWRLINIHKQLGVTLVVYGGPCTTFHVQELHTHASYILEWYKRATYVKRPIIQVCKIKTQRLGVMRIFDSVFATTEENLIDGTCIEWLTDRNPLGGYVSGSRFNSLNDAPRSTSHTTSFQQHRPTTQKGTATATDNMNITKACTLLELKEADTRSEDAVKKSYRRQAMKWHPDKQQGKTAEEITAAAGRFAEISEASDFLNALL
jgi:hypothetical protein